MELNSFEILMNSITGTGTYTYKGRLTDLEQHRITDNQDGSEVHFSYSELTDTTTIEIPRTK